MIQRKQVQGVLAVGYFSPAFFDTLQQAEMPFVMVDHRFDTFQADSVESDNERGGYLATGI